MTTGLSDPHQLDSVAGPKKFEKTPGHNLATTAFQNRCVKTWSQRLHSSRLLSFVFNLWGMTGLAI
jgi:hypothetical protein